MNIFVGNLSFDATQGDVKKLFEGFGNVASVVIVMEKEKKAPKSRGFGFVEMPDEQQAFAAIAALNGKEFMDRVLNVNPARPKGKGHPAVGGAIAEATSQKAVVGLPIGQKDMVCLPLGKAIAQATSQKAVVGLPIAQATSQKAVVGLPIAQATSQKAVVGLPIAQAKTEAYREIESKKKMQPKVKAQAQQYSREEREEKKVWGNSTFRKPGTYKGGRRSRSYMKRHGLTGMEDTKPRRRSQDNPMRWRKRKDQPKPWQRSPDEHKPWKKAEEGARPWKKAEGESKPWRKSEGGIKPWKKIGGEIRTWSKPGEKPKPWKKPAGEAKHWRKGRERPQKSKFNPSTSLGMVRGNGERSRTKGRKNRAAINDKV